MILTSCFSALGMLTFQLVSLSKTGRPQYVKELCNSYYGVPFFAKRSGFQQYKVLASILNAGSKANKSL